MSGVDPLDRRLRIGRALARRSDLGPGACSTPWAAFGSPFFVVRTRGRTAGAAAARNPDRGALAMTKPSSKERRAGGMDVAACQREARARQTARPQKGE